MKDLWQDVRYTLQSFGKNPGFAAVAVLTLGLGIGACTAIFSVVYSVLLSPFPYKHVERLATFNIHFTGKEAESDRDYFYAPELADFQEENHVFEDVIGVSRWNAALRGKQINRVVVGGQVTSNAFEILGVRPQLGRSITVEDGKASSPRVFAMSFGLWTREFHRDPGILGAVFRLNGEPRTLVAIMPERFTLNDCDTWIPVLLRELAQSSRVDAGPHFWPIGVLKPGVTISAAAADLSLVASRAAKKYPGLYLARFAVHTTSLVDSYVGDIRALLLTLMAGVTILLLIACSNVANLLLSRGTAREREMAIRAAIGASPARLGRQLMVESFLLAAFGCLAGCLLALLGLKAAVVLIPSGMIPSEAVIGMSPASLLFAMGASLLTTTLCGLMPTIQALRGDLHAKLSGGGKGVAGDVRRGGLRACLVVAEVALSIILLIGSGLMMRSFLALQHVKLGFDPTNVLIVNFTRAGDYSSAQQKRQFLREVLNRIKMIPGVSYATEAITVPPYSTGLTSVAAPGHPESEALDAVSELCSEDYFRTLGIPVLRGRAFDRDEVESARRVVVVNESFARTFFGSKDPIGQSIRLPSWEIDYADWPARSDLEIVGVVADTKNQSLKQPTRAQVYIPYTMTATGLHADRLVMVKSVINVEAIVPHVNEAVRSADSGATAATSHTMEASLSYGAYVQPRFSFLLLASFATVGLILAVAGVGSVMAYAVSLRTHEIGVRMALGAQQRDIGRMMLKSCFGLLCTGTALGVATSLAITRFIASQIWGVSSTDFWTFSSAAVIILATGLGAGLLPARKASRMDPLSALHYE